MLLYLDAHWREHLPLKEELSLIFGRCRSAVAIVDDFQVPDEPDYEFDDYGPGKRLCIDLLAATGIDFHLFFPTAPASAETGHRRGAVVVTASAEDARILADIPHLRLWRPAVIPHAHAHPSGAQ
jgi:hypothetical protein